MRKLFMMCIAVCLLGACKKKGEPSVVVGSEKKEATSDVGMDNETKVLPFDVKLAMELWKNNSMIEGVTPDSYLCYDIDGDGLKEVMLANRKESGGAARVILSQADGRLNLLQSTVYPAPGAARFDIYIGKGYYLYIVENHGTEYSAYLMKDSKPYCMAYNSMLIVGWDEENDKPIYEFDEEGQPMMGANMDSLEPSEEAIRYLDPKGLVEMMDLEGWQNL